MKAAVWKQQKLQLNSGQLCISKELNQYTGLNLTNTTEEQVQHERNPTGNKISRNDIGNKDFREITEQTSITLAV